MGLGDLGFVRDQEADGTVVRQFLQEAVNEGLGDDQHPFVAEFGEFAGAEEDGGLTAVGFSTGDAGLDQGEDVFLTDDDLGGVAHTGDQYGAVRAGGEVLVDVVFVKGVQGTVFLKGYVGSQ